MKTRLDKKEVSQIVRLRQKGYSLPEIKKITGRGSATISKYIQGIEILPKYYNIWKIKQGGSKARAEHEWTKASNEVKKIIDYLSKKERMLIASCLYWGEGTKAELNLTNADPDLIRVFVECLKDFGVTKDQLRVTIRIYEDIDRNRAISYWAGVMKISKSQILNVNVLQGKKSGKLKYGLCRVRVTRGAPYFKMLKSIIDLIKVNV